LVQAGIAMNSSYNETSPATSCGWGVLVSATWGSLIPSNSSYHYHKFLAIKVGMGTVDILINEPA
jgi:hypothetical protein